MLDTKAPRTLFVLALHTFDFDLPHKDAGRVHRAWPIGGRGQDNAGNLCVLCRARFAGPRFVQDPGRRSGQVGRRVAQTIAVACKANLVHEGKIPQSDLSCVAPAIFAVKVGNEAVGSEWGMLDCARMQMAGTRQVICADTLTILKHLETKKVGMASIKDAHSFLRNAKEDELKAYISSNKLFCGTFGPQDGLVLPAGWVFADKAQGAKDAIGMRAMWLDLRASEPLSKLNDRCHAMNKPNETLNKVVNFQILYEPPE